MKNDLRSVPLLSLFLGVFFCSAGCANPAAEHPKNGEEQERIRALQEENSRLHESLLTARKASEQSKLKAETCEKELNTIRQKQTHEVNELPTEKQVIAEKTQPIQPPPCQYHIELMVDAATPQAISLFEKRLRGWGLERVQVLRGREPNTFDVFFNGYPGDGEKGVESLNSPGELRVYGVAKAGLSPFMVDEFFEQFSTLFPEEAGRINWVRPKEGYSFATSSRASDIETFAKQVAYRAPNLLLLPGPAETRGLWRSWTVHNAPLFTHRSLKEVDTSRDEDGTALLLKFERKATGLPSTETVDEGLPLAFAIDGKIIRTRKLPGSPHGGIRTAELRLPHLSRARESREIPRLASLLKNPGLADTKANARVIAEQCSEPN